MRFKLPSDVKSSRRYVEFPYVKLQMCAGGEGFSGSLKAVSHQTSKIESNSIRQQINARREQGIEAPNSSPPISCLCLPHWNFLEARGWEILGHVILGGCQSSGAQSRAKESGEWNLGANAEEPADTQIPLLSISSVKWSFMTKF